MAFVLKGHVARASRRGQSLLSLSISKIVQAVLDGTKDITEDRRIACASALCDAVAYSMEPCHIFPLLRAGYEESSGGFTLPEHLLTGAVAIGDIDRIRLLLSKGPNEPPRKWFFGDIMQIAARAGRDDILTLLMQSGTKNFPDTVNPEAIAKTFAAACASGHASTVHLLLSYSEASAVKVFRPMIAVSAAAGNGHVALVQTLLQRFQLPNNHDLATQAALAASSRGYLPVVQMLLHHTLDANIVSHEGPKLLRRAARGGHARVVRFLLDHGVSCYGGRGGGALYEAAIRGDQDVVQMLLDHGAEFEAHGRHHCVLDRAARYGEASMIRFLLERRFDFHPEGHKCLDVALAEAVSHCDEETVRLMVGAGASVHGWDGRHVPICRAKVEDKPGLVKALLELGAKDVEPCKCECVHIMFGGTIYVANVDW